MAGFVNPFRRKPPRDAAALARIRAWAAAALGDPPGLDLTISEVECADPACPGLETFILVMRAGEPTVAAKVRKPIAEIGEADIAAALRHL
ncbi:MAG: hypothetical protein LDL25_02940 [Hyphomicrobiales bacterium]|jgi:hypothetical protein|uniref:hypothetical protein n=1 Tax=Rhabdaerophilum calidifontis TaxID=2604328 RepID=UPI00123B3AE9|nr:hypothetical protein [Rhabdaerophilum calidifontis]MCA1951627.1 hypothetical protein [Hyphomicrobiales bacterium]MCA1998722.1 hypothetical protein [Hyphomicrobiales bacterium]